jgi:Family of unknown function (DUF6494)
LGIAPVSARRSAQRHLSNVASHVHLAFKPRWQANTGGVPERKGYYRDRHLSQATGAKWSASEAATVGRPTMDEETLNTSVRKFLKRLGVTAQREIEKAVRAADAKGELSGTTLPAKAVVTVGGIDLTFEIDGDIELA